MAKTPPPAGFWSHTRRICRRIRMVVWALVFMVIIALLYLNQIGLPDFVKRPLLDKLRAHGIELRFKNLRLSWHRGFVAYNVEFGGTKDPASPRLTAQQAQIGLKGGTLWRLNFQLGGMSLRNARLAWPLGGTNELALDKINAELRFLPGDEWQLVNLEAQMSKAHLSVGGSLTHATAVRDWEVFKHPRPGTPANPEQELAHIRRIAEVIEKLKLGRDAEIRVDFSGDALGKEPFHVGIRSKLGTGGLVAQAILNPATRELTFVARSDVDPRRIRPLLTAKADTWLGRFSWENPPQLRAYGSVIVPNPTNGVVDWKTDVLPTLKIDAEFHVGHAAFRDVPVLAAHSRVLYADQTWQLPDLHVKRPEGELQIAHWTQNTTKDYYWHIQGTFDPKSVRPLVDPGIQRGLDLVELTTPPRLDVEMWSRWYERERTGVKGHFSVSNVMFRGESAKTIDTELEYTNLWLHLDHPVITRGINERGTLDSVDVDFRTKTLYLSNGNSTVDPGALTRAIGPKVAKAVAPYVFLTPPTGHIEGSTSLTNAKIADLKVQITGGPFHWWKFTVPYVTGDIVWSNHDLLLTNVSADFYDGKLAGSAAFDFTPPVGDNFHFAFQAADADLSKLLPDLGKGTNAHQLSGKLTGRLVVTWANSRDMLSWQGFGDMSLRDGQLWEIPVFGIFAPVLDVLYPNLGSGKASDGTATFAITNSVILTDNLELRSPTMRIQYKGTVDFDGRLNARAEAELLRNTAVIGPMISTMLWPVTKLLEYKILGTLSKPEPAPVFIPKALLFPLHPFQSLKNMFIDSGSTNPPTFTDPPLGSGAKRTE